ncbi:VIT and vWA domain-containing protein [Vibrio sp. WJH972]
MKILNRFKQKITLALAALVLAPFASASGLLKPVSSQYQDLEIEQHHVDVVIEDSYATTSIEQEFYNPNDTDLEAIYSFPVPKGAVVGEFMYWIDDNPVIAEAVKKNQARKIYEEQKSQGRATAITEKDDYKTFDISVYPVRAKQSVKVKLVYIQNELIDHGIGHYVYPLEEGGVDEARDSFWSRNDDVKSQFSFNMHLRSSYPVDGVRLPAHPQANVTQVTSQEWKATIGNVQPVNSEAAFDNADEETPTLQSSANPVYTLDNDIVFYWRQTEGLPGRLDMVTYRDPSESSKGTFKLTFTPGDDLSPISSQRDWVFILDKSGSMNAKYATLVEGVKQAMGQLPSNDRFRIVVFDQGVTEVTSGYEAVTPNNVQQALLAVENIGTGGGTNLYAGLKEGMSNLDDDRPSGLILVTDGVANVGVTQKEEFIDLMKQYDVRLFTFIMGNSANRPLLESMTKVSNGFAQSISNSDDIMGHLMSATSKLNHQAYRNVRIDIDGTKVKNLTPEEIRTLYRGEQLSVFGHYFKPGQVKVTLKADIGSNTEEYTTTIALPEQSTDNPELERLWAFSAIKDMEASMNYLGVKDADTEQALEELALEYGLLTDYTSLLVVEEDVFAENAIDRTNKTRVEKEQKARELRKTQDAKPTRADTQQPAYQTPVPSYSGGGSSGGSTGGIALAMLLLVAVFRKKQMS